MLFSELGLSPALLKSLELAGYTEATPIQAQAIPHILAGKDMLGTAQTGTGKTAAFALPTLQRVSDSKAASGTNKSVVRCLVLTPTRELALQVNTSLNKYGRSGVGGAQGVGAPLRFAAIFGGVSQFRQVDSLKSGVDILVATPGRLEDLQNQGLIDLSNVELFILDEADQMLDMGFIVPIRRIAKRLRPDRQTLMFSATMPREIKQLASETLKPGYTEVSVAPSGTAAENVMQQAFHISKSQKGVLLRHFLADNNLVDNGKSLVFSKTKHGADRIARGLVKAGITAAAIHGNRSQAQRNRALDAFKKGDVAVLVATDVAARGLHISDVSHVINFDLPMTAETYIHRIGRTGRAGASGIAVSFVDNGDRGILRDIERLTKKKMEMLVTPELPEAPASDRERNEDAELNDIDVGTAFNRGGNRNGGNNRGGDRGGFRNNAPAFNRQDGGGRPSFNKDPARGNFRARHAGNNDAAPAATPAFRQDGSRNDDRPQRPFQKPMNNRTGDVRPEVRSDNGGHDNRGIVRPNHDVNSAGGHAHTGAIHRRPEPKFGNRPTGNSNAGNAGGFNNASGDRAGNGGGNFRNNDRPSSNGRNFGPRKHAAPGAGPQGTGPNGAATPRRLGEQSARPAKTSRTPFTKPGTGIKKDSAKRASFQRNG